MRFQSYLNTAVNLIKQYPGDAPLVHYLKQYFSLNKKHGSKDRKYISQLCWCYYRLGHSLNDLDTEQKIKVAIFLCSKAAGEWSVLYNMEWLENWSPILSDRLIFICTKYPSFKVIDIFPFENELSETIDATVFAQSYLIQPSLFLRIRPGKKKTVTDKLLMHHIVYEEIAQDCFAITNTTKIDTIIELNKEAVIQDYSSQRIKEFLDPQIINYKSAMKVWDCCAASGGKSILVIDMPGKTDLTVSDIRPAILNNLKKRFKEAGIKKFNSFISDVTIKSYNIPYSPFDLIICDAPCSGSGTWGRTPEQLAYITTEKILEYAALQKKIIAGTIIHLNTEGYFLYITCSVFKKENEDAVKFICDNYNMKIIKQELLKGYNKKADTMFAALFTRNA